MKISGHRLLKWSIIPMVLAIACGSWSYINSKSKVVMTSQLTAKEPVMQKGDALVDIRTTEGDIRVRLFADTPRHRDNFLKLVKEGYYNNVLFHRVINEFMVQTEMCIRDRSSPAPPAGTSAATTADTGRPSGSCAADHNAAAAAQGSRTVIFQRQRSRDVYKRQRHSTFAM